MDFKTRFQGKISHISKDGAFDTVILHTGSMVPIGKPSATTGLQTLTGTTTPAAELSTPLKSISDHQSFSNFGAASHQL
jgi:hypothetical protein